MKQDKEKTNLVPVEFLRFLSFLLTNFEGPWLGLPYLKYAPQILLCIVQMLGTMEEKLNFKTKSRIYRWVKQQRGKETE